MVEDLTGGGVQTNLRKQSRATVTSMPLSCIVILLASLVLSDVQKIGTRDDNKRFLHFFPGRPQENNFNDGIFLTIYTMILYGNDALLLSANTSELI